MGYILFLIVIGLMMSFCEWLNGGSNDSDHWNNEPNDQP